MRGQRIGYRGAPQDENRGGDHFHAYLEEHDLAAVYATCETDGPAYTCKGNGQMDRIDYIVLPARSIHAATHS